MSSRRNPGSLALAGRVEQAMAQRETDALVQALAVISDQLAASERLSRAIAGGRSVEIRSANHYTVHVSDLTLREMPTFPDGEAML